VTEIDPHELVKAKAWRFRRNLTQGELAYEIGYSVSAVSYFERGVMPPRAGETVSRPMGARAWRRYRMLCELVELRLRLGRQPFDW
jgi:DNA-binding XRE family transcriptional regulator